MALTLRYVAINGLSTNGGTSWADAWDYATAMADATTHKVIYIRHHTLNANGTASGASAYTIGAGLPDAATACTTANVYIVGCRASDDGPAETITEGPIFDGAGGTYTTLGLLRVTGAGALVHGMQIKNSPAYGILTGTSVGICIHLCKVTASTLANIRCSSADAHVICCVADDSSASGIENGSSNPGLIAFCSATGNNIYQIETSTGPGSAIVGCLVRQDASATVASIGLPNNGLSLYNTIDNNGRSNAGSHGVDCGNLTKIVGCILDNGASATGQDAIDVAGSTTAASVLIFGNLYYGWGTNVGTGDVAVNSAATTATDPAIDSNFETTVDIRTGFSRGMLQDLALGGWQALSSGSSGGLLTHPGMTGGIRG